MEVNTSPFLNQVIHKFQEKIPLSSPASSKSTGVFAKLFAKKYETQEKNAHLQSLQKWNKVDELPDKFETEIIDASKVSERITTLRKERNKFKGNEDTTEQFQSTETELTRYKLVAKHLIAGKKEKIQENAKKIAELKKELSQNKGNAVKENKKKSIQGLQIETAQLKRDLKLLQKALSPSIFSRISWPSFTKQFGSSDVIGRAGDKALVHDENFKAKYGDVAPESLIGVSTARNERIREDLRIVERYNKIATWVDPNPQPKIKNDIVENLKICKDNIFNNRDAEAYKTIFIHAANAIDAFAEIEKLNTGASADLKKRLLNQLNQQGSAEEIKNEVYKISQEATRTLQNLQNKSN